MRLARRTPLFLNGGYISLEFLLLVVERDVELRHANDGALPQSLGNDW